MHTVSLLQNKQHITVYLWQWYHISFNLYFGMQSVGYSNTTREVYSKENT